jgi:UDP-N-acetylglucosamine--N-acetylmuramyl-(pentapeptide) pyrophosphoryl-undecaprenol N-acetylglucosamine transferase
VSGGSKTEAAGTVVLTAGGTGGHLFPALALAQELQRRGIVVDLITDMRGDRYGSDFPARKVYQVPSDTIRSRSPLAMAKTGTALASGVAKARGILGEIAPKAVIGFGGYPSLPPMLAAWMKGIPTAIHEQNAVLGRANRFLSKRVTAIATSFHGVKGIDVGTAAKVRFTGNPVRDVVLEWAREAYVPPAATGPFQILIFGGSQGAKFFSDLVPQALATYPPEARSALRIVQQARQEDVERVEAAYKAAGISATISPFFSNLPEAMANAHLVIGRAGASTVSELTVMGRPSILVPLPHALDNDQLNNAQRLASSGGAICVEQKDLTAERLAADIGQLLDDPTRLGVMAAAARVAGRPNAVVLLANMVEELMGRWTPATV